MSTHHWGKRLSLLLVAIMALGMLAACGGKGNDGNNGNNGGTAGGSAGNNGAAAEPMKLVFWNVGLNATDDSGEKTKDELALYRYVKKFEDENPGVTIEVVNQPAENIGTLLKAARVSKKGPDLIGQWAGGATNDFKDLLQPLDSYLTDDEKAQYSGLDIGKVDFKPDGKVQALPYNVTTYNIFYNKAVFAKAGISEIPQVTTWDQYLQLCEQLKQKNVTPLYVGEKEGYVATWVTSEFLLDQLGPDQLSKLGTGEIKFSGPEFKQAMNAWKQVYEKKYTNKDYVTLAAWDSMEQFADSGAAMTINGSWTISDLTKQLGDDLGTMQIPAITADAKYGEYLVSQPGANISVSTFTKHADMAAKFAKFITSGEFQTEYYKDTGDIPANTTADLAQIDNPITKTALTWIQKDKTGLGFDSLISGEASSEFYKLASAVVYGKMSVDEMAKNVDAKIKPAS